MTKTANLGESSRPAWYSRSGGALTLSVISLVLAYLAASRAIFTGSLQQYVLAYVLVGFAADRAVVSFRSRKKESK